MTGFNWRLERFHKQLLFGLASATAIFGALAKALECVLQHRGLSKAVLHDFNNVLLLAPPPPLAP